MLGVSEGTVCSMVGDGLPVVKIKEESLKIKGSRRSCVMFRESEVRAWIARKPKVEVEVPETGDDGLAKGVDRAGVLVAGVMFALMAAGLVYGAVMAFIG